MDRAIEIIRKRTDAFGVSEPEISRIGSDSIRVGLPNVSNAAHASEEVGQTAQLQLYDWEPNIIPNPAKTNVPRSESCLQPRSTTRSSSPPSSSRTASRTSARPAGPQYYLFNSQTHAWIAGPDRHPEGPLLGAAGPEAAAEHPGDLGPAGHDRGGEGGSQRRRQQTDDPNDTGAEWFVIRDRPALSGTDIKDPKASFDQFDQPNVTFNFTDQGRQEFADTTRAIAQRGLQNAPPGHRRQLPGGRRLLRPLRDRPRPADQVAADHQLRRQPRRDRRLDRRPDQRAAPPASPRTWRRSCRSARCRST